MPGTQPSSYEYVIIVFGGSFGFVFFSYYV